ncbi:GyrI-like domain-containing protein [Companilactobacillus kimchii]|uniref:GyrI-like small molecule binding domain-containing protein n=2 Tax=Companilactobacillus kimchii TaxID=2801452 RepID=A0ABR5NS02_9LACO|nr:GyrI-like domain-containing protein [Companilactobacillus kimchii]KAE9557778.1 hypothetical protein ATN91_03160 [Companilactobacillus kimchii]KRK50906.1 hypothetical protein FC97_GL001191 [Companilactobacillus kimchii DSM 13961 = JCM 10707]OWF33601.1 hypothetical protein LKACC12383_00741 [Companilactobacillus kimchii]GEO48142.1 hypothetical protein LKI01_21410 [Companilactobacillus paralimentarius]
MKYEWRKQEKELYSTKRNPQILSIQSQKFTSLHGIGDPNGSEFSKKIQTLYPVAYGIKSAYRKYAVDKNLEFDDYVVFPLEGVWSLTAKGQQLDHLDKNEFSYDIMIRIPNFVPDDVISVALQNVKEKKNPSEIDKLEIKTYPALEIAQILHVGSYDDEPASFEKIDQFVSEQNKQRASKIHREIYLSDARRVAPDKRKTILRYQVK